MALRAVPEHPKFAALKSILKQPKGVVLGWLETMWHFTGRFTPQGNIGKYPDSVIEAWVEWDGIPGDLMSALVQSRWIDPSPADRLIVHDWSQHADESVQTDLARKQLLFADGRIPNSGRLNQHERTRFKEWLDTEGLPKPARGRPANNQPESSQNTDINQPESRLNTDIIENSLIRLNTVTTATESAKNPKPVPVPGPEPEPVPGAVPKEALPPTPASGGDFHTPSVNSEDALSAAWWKFLDTLKRELCDAPMGHPNFSDIVRGKTDWGSCFADWELVAGISTSKGIVLHTRSPKPDVTEAGVRKYAQRITRISAEVFSSAVEFRIAKPP